MATLGQYLDWLESIGGSHRTGIRADDARGMLPVTKLIAPSGRSVISSGRDRDEALSVYTVDYLDRRLQLLSPFRSVDR